MFCTSVDALEFLSSLNDQPDNNSVNLFLFEPSPIYESDDDTKTDDNHWSNNYLNDIVTAMKPIFNRKGTVAVIVHDFYSVTKWSEALKANEFHVEPQLFNVTYEPSYVHSFHPLAMNVNRLKSAGFSVLLAHHAKTPHKRFYYMKDQKQITVQNDLPPWCNCYVNYVPARMGDLLLDSNGTIVNKEQISQDFLSSLILRFTEPGDIVVDFCAGTGGVAMAALCDGDWKLSRKCYINDSNQDLLTLAKNKIEKTVISASLESLQLEDIDAVKVSSAKNSHCCECGSSSVDTDTQWVSAELGKFLQFYCSTQCKNLDLHKFNYASQLRKSKPSVSYLVTDLRPYTQIALDEIDGSDSEVFKLFASVTSYKWKSPGITPDASTIKLLRDADCKKWQVEVKKSSIPNSGDGCYTCIDRVKGNILTLF